MNTTDPLDANTRLAIQDLLVAYSWAIDSGDSSGVAALFAEHGEFHSSEGGIIKGRTALEAFAAKVASSRDYRLQHLAQNHVFVVLDPATVRVRSYVQIFVGDAEGPRLLGMGAYEDEVVLTAGGWRFARRRYESWGREPRPAVARAGDD